MTESWQRRLRDNEPGCNSADVSGAASEWVRTAWHMALSGGLPTLPGYIFELNGLLSSRQVDLKCVSNIIRTDPALSANVIRMCNLPWSEGRPDVHSIEEAVLLLGRERLRTLVLTCSLTQQTGGAVAPKDLHSFWQHSFLTALLSERLAQAIGYHRPERAYLAGLLHDVGLLALQAAHARQPHARQREFPLSLSHILDGESESSGRDHCEAGRAIGVAWEFPADLVEVLERHHNPSAAVHDPLLVGIVAAADQVSRLRDVGPGSRPRLVSADAAVYNGVFAACLPQVASSDRGRLAEVMEVEFQRVTPMLEFDQSGILGYARPGTSDDEIAPVISWT